MMGYIYQAPLTVSSGLWLSIHLLSPASSCLHFLRAVCQRNVFCRNLSLLSICTYAPLKASCKVWLCSVAISLIYVRLLGTKQSARGWTSVCCVLPLSLLGPLRHVWGKSGEEVFMGLGRLAGECAFCAWVCWCGTGGMLGSRQPRAGNVSLPSCRADMCSQSQDRSSTVPRKTKQGTNGGLLTAMLKLHRTGCSP